VKNNHETFEQICQPANCCRTANCQTVRAPRPFGCFLLLRFWMRNGAK